jgi:hypothetical protein
MQQTNPKFVSYIQSANRSFIPAPLQVIWGQT